MTSFVLRMSGSTNSEDSEEGQYRTIVEPIDDAAAVKDLIESSQRTIQDTL